MIKGLFSTDFIYFYYLAGDLLLFALIVTPFSLALTRFNVITKNDKHAFYKWAIGISILASAIFAIIQIVVF